MACDEKKQSSLTNLFLPNMQHKISHDAISSFFKVAHFFAIDGVLLIDVNFYAFWLLLDGAREGWFLWPFSSIYIFIWVAVWRMKRILSRTIDSSALVFVFIACLTWSWNRASWRNCSLSSNMKRRYCKRVKIVKRWSTRVTMGRRSFEHNSCEHHVHDWWRLIRRKQRRKSPRSSVAGE